MESTSILHNDQRVVVRLLLRFRYFVSLWFPDDDERLTNDESSNAVLFFLFFSGVWFFFFNRGRNKITCRDKDMDENKNKKGWKVRMKRFREAFCTSINSLCFLQEGFICFCFFLCFAIASWPKRKTESLSFALGIGRRSKFTCSEPKCKSCLH